MLVRFFSRGRGGSAGPINYLLGRKRDRVGASVLRGDVQQTADLIDSLKFRRRYTSGCLSFAEQTICSKTKNTIMDEFERAVFAGLDRDQYDILWIEHTDKDRIELNFVIPNVELLSGKRLQPYYDRADRNRINHFQQYINARFDLADPNDPARKRVLTTAADLPKDKELAAHAITNGLLALLQQGAITNRQGVIDALASNGFTVTRETKSSISIAIEGSDKPLRLKGAIYEREFTFDASSESIRAQCEAAERDYRATLNARCDASLAAFNSALAAKQKSFAQRYSRDRAAFADVDKTASVDKSNSDVVALAGARSALTNSNQQQTHNNATRAVAAPQGVFSGAGLGRDTNTIDRVSDKTHRSINERLRNAISSCITAAIATARAAVARCIAASSDVGRRSDETSNAKSTADAARERRAFERLTERQQQPGTTARQSSDIERGSAAISAQNGRQAHSVPTM